jgi:predicted carbohydrate-binding protein with CBM5 and CBM33 domain
MIAHRRAAVALAGAVPLLFTALAAGPARAHGAPTDPVSRAAACGLQGSGRDSEACHAAATANGGVPVGAWDDLKIANVRDRDREMIPDGRLCSAGLEEYRGLDIPRPDWPATRLSSSGDFTLTYRSTTAHKGSFSLYVTRPGHDPSIPLRWSDLQEQPFAAVTDPALEDGAYRVRGKLPAGLTGRHVIYTVWRTTDTPDTYYSCSDVILTDSSGSVPRSAQPASRPIGSAQSAAGPGDIHGAAVVGGSIAVLVLLALGVSTVLRRGR